MNKLKLSAWEQVSLWAMVAVCLLPLVPYALNGPTSVENCTLRCRCHNRLTAEWIFGRCKIDSAMAQARKDRGPIDSATAR